MNKIKKTNDCKIKDVETYFNLTEKCLFDHFDCIDHFLRWYKFDFPSGIYFLNLSNINKCELSTFLDCDESIFDDLVFDSNKRKSYDSIKEKFPLSNIMYMNIDEYIYNLSDYKNKILFKNLRAMGRVC